LLAFTTYSLSEEGSFEHRGHGERFLLIQSGLRRAVAASAAQVGDVDWIKKLWPRSGMEQQLYMFSVL